MTGLSPEPTPSSNFCPCLGTLHKVFCNCLNCGKIICSKEIGYSCTFCSELLVHATQYDPEELENMKAELDMESEDAVHIVEEGLQTRDRNVASEKHLSHTTTKARSSGSKPISSAKALSSDAATLRSSDVSNRVKVDDTSVNQKQTIQKSRLSSKSNQHNPASGSTGVGSGVINSRAHEKAIERKEKLLHFDRNSAARTTVRDDDAEWFQTSAGSREWLSTEEAAAAEARAASATKALHQQKTELSLSFGLNERGEVGMNVSSASTNADEQVRKYMKGKKRN